MPCASMATWRALPETLMPSCAACRDEVAYRGTHALVNNPEATDVSAALEASRMDAAAAGYSKPPPRLARQRKWEKSFTATSWRAQTYAKHLEIRAASELSLKCSPHQEHWRSPHPMLRVLEHQSTTRQSRSSLPSIPSVFVRSPAPKMPPLLRNARARPLNQRLHLPHPHSFKAQSHLALPHLKALPPLHLAI